MARADKQSVSSFEDEDPTGQESRSICFTFSIQLKITRQQPIGPD
jgi:hypothetical protein